MYGFSFEDYDTCIVASETYLKPKFRSKAVKTLLSFSPLFIIKCTSQRLTSFTSQRFTLFPYQKDEWALPVNLQSERIFCPTFKMYLSQLSLHFLSLSFLLSPKNLTPEDSYFGVCRDVDENCHSTQVIPESPSRTLNSGCENRIIGILTLPTHTWQFVTRVMLLHICSICRVISKYLTLLASGDSV